MSPDERQNAAPERRWATYFDLEMSLREGDEGRFHLALHHDDVPETWLPMAALYDGRLRWDYQQRLYAGGRGNLANKIEHLEKAFKDYPVTLVPMTTDDLGEAAQSFQRINRQGTHMGEAHMLRALTYEPDFDLDEIFGRLNGRLAWGEIPNDIFVLALKSIEGLDLYDGDPEPLVDALKRSTGLLDLLTRSVEQATSFLRERCGIYSMAALPYDVQLIALVDVAANRKLWSSPISCLNSRSGCGPRRTRSTLRV
ncbi:MAG: hypothetical protein AAGF11_37575 [Myxococcota bacterium]